MNKTKEKQVLSFTEKGISFSISLLNKKIEQIVIKLSNKNKNRTIPSEYSYIYTQFYNYLYNKKWEFSLPLKWEKLTPFQIKVYKEILKVPLGRIATYKQIATRIGGTKYSRSVGMALSKNPFPIVIPCHRIVPTLFNKDKVGGFSAGIRLKKILLLIENQNIFNRGEKN